MTGGGSITYRSAASGLLNLPGHAGSILSTSRNVKAKKVRE